MNHLKYLLAAFVCLLFIIPMQAQNVGRDKTVRVSSYSVTKIKKEKTKKTIYAPVDKRWENTLNLQGENYSLGLQYEGAYRMGKVASLGFGLGYNYSGNVHRIPAYLKFKLFVASEYRTNLFFGLAQGVDLLFYHLDFQGHLLPHITSECVYSEWMGLGSHSRFELGLNIRLTPKSSMFISGDVGLSPYAYVDYSNYYGGDYRYSEIRHGFVFGVNLGFTF